jgi:N utilization substance protein A
MMVTLGENGIKTVEDLADCATDDLAGWSERKEKETIRHDGILDGFGLTKNQVEELILAARIKAGWINEADLAPEPTEGEGEEVAGTGEGAESGGVEAPSGASAS